MFHQVVVMEHTPTITLCAGVMKTLGVSGTPMMIERGCATSSLDAGTRETERMGLPQEPHSGMGAMRIHSVTLPIALTGISVSSFHLNTTLGHHHWLTQEGI